MAWRVRQDSNLQPPDLESDALPIRATDPRVRAAVSPGRLADLGLFVQRVAATTRAELFNLELLSLLLFVPGGHIVAPLAAVAR